MWYFTKKDLFRLGDRYGFEGCGTVRLRTLSFGGLRDRVFYFQNQNIFVSVAGFLAALFMLPILRFLPSDLGVAVLRKPA
jgi:hypothetical protein